MKAYVVKKYGKNETLHVADVSEPNIQAHEVLIEVYAAGVNQLDSLIKNGDFKAFLPYKTPFIIGHDVAGTVVKVGSKVAEFKLGDEVYSRPRDHHIGTFAEYISIHEGDLALKPKNLSMEEAAAIPLVGLTVWQALVERADVQKGEKVFIQAGSGGVGSLAIQLAKHLGATVATTTSGDNIEWVKNLGADIVIDYKKENFATILKDYDVVLHSNKDGKVLESALRILKSGGRLVSLTGPASPEFAEELGLPWYFKLVMYFLSFKAKRLARKLQVHFSFLFMRASGAQLREITLLIESGDMHPIIDRVFPFAETNEALEYVEAGRSKGKVVIKVR